jgi:fumarylacetoacetase
MVESSIALKSNIDYSAEHPFPLENIPFGVFENVKGERHVCTRIGDFVIDLAVLKYHGALGGPLFSKLASNCFDQPSINEFMSLGKDYWHETRVSI